MTTNTVLKGENVALGYADCGQGRAVIFQHGLGGDRNQAAEAFGQPDGFRRLTLECRGHAVSDYGPLQDLSITTFANDIMRLSSGLGVSAPVVGGISMGAALALNLAAKGELGASALILARPAWLFEKAPPNMAVYGEVGKLLRDQEPNAARELFLDGASADRLRREAPDNLASMVGFFARPNPRSFGELLISIAQDAPGVSEAEARRIELPVLVIGHGQDLVHPLAYAKELAAILPNAQFCEITPKSEDKQRYVREFQAAILEFLGRLQ